MAVRVVKLPNGRVVTLAAYGVAWRRLRNTDPATRVCGFGHSAEPAGAVLAAMRAGMHDRINRHIPGYGSGRKWDSQWQRDAGHTARLANGRAVLRWVPKDLRSRLAHRVHAPDAGGL